MKQNLDLSMRQRQEVPMDIDARDNTDEYVECIYHKTMSEIEDPVLSPYNGHIYERMDLINLIAQGGGTALDPLVRKPLTEDMLVPGKFVKQVVQESRNKSVTRENVTNNDVMIMLLKMNSKIQEQGNEIKTLTTEITDLKVKNKNLEEANSFLRNEVTRLEKKVIGLDAKVLDLDTQLKLEKTKVENLTSDNKKLETENKSLIEKNKSLQTTIDKHQLWAQYGTKIDEKLKKGSTPERMEALKNYVDQIKNASDPETLKKAVNNISPFYSDEIRLRRFFPPCGDSETSRVAKEFKNEVNRHKNW